MVIYCWVITTPSTSTTRMMRCSHEHQGTESRVHHAKQRHVLRHCGVANQSPERQEKENPHIVVVVVVVVVVCCL